MAAVTTEPTAEVGPSSWAETRCRHPDDDDLRAAGFVILSRPKSGPALWRRDGRSYTEGAACELARRKRAG
jgi:hypothetical protein